MSISMSWFAGQKNFWFPSQSLRTYLNRMSCVYDETTKCWLSTSFAIHTIYPKIISEPTTSTLILCVSISNMSQCLWLVFVFLKLSTNFITYPNGEIRKVHTWKSNAVSNSILTKSTPFDSSALGWILILNGGDKRHYDFRLYNN